MAPPLRARGTRASPAACPSPARRLLGVLGLALAGVAGVRCGSAPPRARPLPPDQLAAQCRTRPQNTDPEVTPPRLIHRVEPAISPTDPSPVFVCLDAVVTTDGRVTELKVLKSGGGAMDVAALNAVRQWRYAPATRNGVPIAYPLNIGISMASR
ncbi:MAG TPA: energy transducer TonB [Thermoanaerobaculia bacterium]|nr:energy transducer TonB [Thermoanaerobaculia bacterium]